MELTYRTEGDYHLPNLEAPEPRRSENMDAAAQLPSDPQERLLHGDAPQRQAECHLEKIDRQATEMVEQLTARMAREQGVTEELKASDQMKWVGLMNNIRAAAEEVALTELVYADA